MSRIHAKDGISFVKTAGSEKSWSNKLDIGVRSVITYPQLLVTDASESGYGKAWQRYTRSRRRLHLKKVRSGA